MSLIRRYAHASLTSLLAKAATVLGTLGVMWLSNRILDKADFGLFMLAFTTMIMLAMVLASPFFALVLYKVSPLAEGGRTDPLSRNLAGKSLIFSMLIGLLGASFLSLLANEIARLIDKPGLVYWFQGLALMLPLDIGRLVLTFWYRARQEIAVSVFYQETLPNILRCLFLAFAWLLDSGPEGVIAAMLAAQILPLLRLYVRDPVWPQWREAGFAKGDAIYGLQNMFSQVVNEPTRSLDLIFLGTVAAAGQVADYALAARLSRLLLVPRQALSQLIVPRFGPLLKAGDMAALKLEYDAIRMLSLFCALAGLGFIMTLGPFILSLFGDYRGALPLFIILSFAQVLICGFGNNSGLLGIAGHAFWVMLTGILSTLIVLVGGTLAAQSFGAMGMALAVLTANLALFGLLVYPCRTLLHLATMNAVTTLIMIAAAALVTFAVLRPDLHIVMGLLVWLLAGLQMFADRSAALFWRTHQVAA